MLDALLTVFSPYNLLLAFLGTLFGIVIGIIPGLGPALGLALLIPVVLPLNPVTALIVLGSCFGAAIYGGCISAILVNTPGTPGNVATTFDGYPLAQQGKAAYAIGAATMASGIGGLFGIAALALLGPPIAKFSLNFGPSEYFMLALVGLAFISRTIKGNFLRGMISALFGLVLSFVGLDITTGFPRFSFGLMYLEDGVQFIPSVIGLFALSQAFLLAEQGGSISLSGKVESKNVLAGALEPFKRWSVTLRAAIIGTVLGTTPGIGIATANVLAYTEAARASKHPETFGKGNIEGVIAPETANNAVEGGSLIPALTLGIPGGATAAIFLGAMNLFGIQTGFKLYTANANMLYALILAMALGTIMFVVIGLSSVKALAKLTVVKNEILVPAILVMCVLGSYAMRYNFGDVWLCLIMGGAGYLLRKMNFPIVPMIIAMVLGPIAEQGFIRAMLISNWSYAIFVNRPIPLILLILGIIIMISPAFDLIKRKKAAAKAVQG